MRFKLDENLPESLASLIAAAGHDCETVANEGLSGADDDGVYQRCKDEQRALLTLDLDFSDIRAYPPAAGPGTIVLRPAQQNIASLRQLAVQAMQLLGQEPLPGRLWIVEPGHVRIRE